MPEQQAKTRLDYYHIAAWGWFLGSFPYYVAAEQQKALETNAPIDAIYQNQDGSWSVASEISDPETKAYIERRAEAIRSHRA